MYTQGLAHIALMANDYKSTIQFYKDVFGFTVGYKWTLPSFKIDEATMLVSPDGVTCIEIFDRKAEVPAQGKKASNTNEVKYGALLHFAIYVSDVDKVFQCAINHKAAAISKPEYLKLGDRELTVYNAIVEGLNGEMIEIIQTVDFNILNK
ncbi:VOC family protein [Rummeliibacillus suwonensis]|uniref:VOC family protein n=1 Tax=Rummeliibacillus suwonensis TaxID=1306154 RepID=UPI001AAE6F6D|nr:VOC family protein [Rummeliibacillus suwonensis]MBO2535649.1 VOC family protein [Rummeliibacillus suwonensis]